MWAHGAVFLLGAAYTLLNDGHVRIDVFYRSASPRYKAWVNLVGSVCMGVPVVWVIFSNSLSYVLRSWRGLESSAEAGGLPGLFVLKTVIPVFCVLFALQIIVHRVCAIFWSCWATTSRWYRGWRRAARAADGNSRSSPLLMFVGRLRGAAARLPGCPDPRRYGPRLRLLRQPASASSTW